MTDYTDSDPVTDCCRQVFGIDYPYPWQRLVIASVLDSVLPGADTDNPPEPLRKIAVLPTGAGKSLCWMLPAVLISGITVAVFPLLSLMSDQQRRLDSCGIPSTVLKGGQERTERREIWRKLAAGEVRIILANPEVLQTREVEERLGQLVPSFLAVDETHTVSQWGETFRPACAGLGRIVRTWNPRAVLALTATAGPLIRSRITELLFNGEPPDTALADPDRPAIRYGVLPVLSRNHMLERLAAEQPRPMIVFGSTRPAVEQAARLLRYRLQDDRISFYHAGLAPGEKKNLEEWFLTSRDGILCATCAYGMGVDKVNVRSVIHLAPPASVEAYLQESGRASRDGLGANAWLIVTPEDALGLGDLRNDSPEREGVGRSAEAASGGDSDRQGVPVDPGASPTPPSDVIKGSSPQSTDAEAIARARRAAMIRYAASTDRCRREILLEALGIEAEDCTGCDVCGGEAWTDPPEREVILKVVRWNRGRFRKGQLARILIGRRTAEIRRTGLDLVRGFGALSGWELEDAEEAIDALLQSSRIQYRGLKIKNIYPTRKKPAGLLGSAQPNGIPVLSGDSMA